jgi:hypothetical protein
MTTHQIIMLSVFIGSNVLAGIYEAWREHFPITETPELDDEQWWAQAQKSNQLEHSPPLLLSPPASSAASPHDELWKVSRSLQDRLAS